MSAAEVFDALRDEILSGALRPGDIIVETSVARRLGSSHTPVREAIMQLIGQGFVETDSTRRRHVARYSARRASELVRLQGLLYQHGLLRAASRGSAAQIAGLAEAFAEAAQALGGDDVRAIYRTTAEVVTQVCTVADSAALTPALANASQRGFALILLPPEAWELWREWGATMDGFAARLAVGEVTSVADDYLAAEATLAAEIERRWPEDPGATSTPVGQTRTGAVADRLRSEILEGRLAPGAPVREVDVARRLQVSTTPVREALRLLAAEGLLEVAANGRRTVATCTDATLADHVDLLRHLTRWQLQEGWSALTEATLSDRAAPLRELAAQGRPVADPARLVEALVSLWETIGIAAGDREVSGVVRRTTRVLMPRWVAAPTCADRLCAVVLGLTEPSPDLAGSMLPALLEDLIEIARPRAERMSAAPDTMTE